MIPGLRDGIFDALKQAALDNLPCPTDAEIADVIGLQATNIPYHLSQMEADGVIRRERRSGPQRRVYIVECDAWTGWTKRKEALS